MVENENLKKQISELKNLLNQLQEIHHENKRLKRLLDFKERSKFKLVASRVIGYAPDNYSSVVIIDKGRKNGIKEDMTVITPEGLVGRIIQADFSFSKVMLVNDPDFRVSCRIQRSRQEGIISGALGKNLIMRYLPWDADIEVNDIVITSGLTDIYPKGIIVGRVTEINSDFVGINRYAVVK
ncbi:MAG: rod shape-determining protein MreC, partial [Candidatus Omnitrophica bacterium]|nr:rod shape-determining protein MreC [Candidatus Omnitrophota bacterium]